MLAQKLPVLFLWFASSQPPYNYIIINRQQNYLNSTYLPKYRCLQIGLHGLFEDTIALYKGLNAEVNP